MGSPVLLKIVSENRFSGKTHLYTIHPSVDGGQGRRCTSGGHRHRDRRLRLRLRARGADSVGEALTDEHLCVVLGAAVAGQSQVLEVVIDR